MLKINTTSKYAEFKFDDKSDLYPLNEISYTIENESETVSFYNRFYKKIITEQLSNIQVNDVQITRDNIQDLLSVLFTGYEGGGNTSVDLSNYYTKVEVDVKDNNKVDKVDGKQLSTEDYTTVDKNKLAGLSNYDDTTVKGSITANTAAINAEVTRATAAEKVNADAIAAVDAAYKAADTTLQGNIDAEITRATAAESALDTKINAKVDKVEGKQLSTEDYTTAEKEKLVSLTNYDDTTVKGSITANTAAINAEVNRAKAAESTLNSNIPTVQTSSFGNDKNFIFSEGQTGSTKNVISQISAGNTEYNSFLYLTYWGQNNISKNIRFDSATYEKAGIMTAEDKSKLDYNFKYAEITATNGKLNLLNTAILQHTIITENIMVFLPAVYNGYKEIHLLFDGITGSTITFPSDIIWVKSPTEIKEGVVYEFIFTWVNTQEKWFGGYIKYE